MVLPGAADVKGRKGARLGILQSPADGGRQENFKGKSKKVKGKS
jgi:hypothetical protein